MERPPPCLTKTTLLLLLLLHVLLSGPRPSLCLCTNKCGPLDVRFPFGTGYGCGSPLFHPSVTCTPAGGGDSSSSNNTNNDDQLTLTTHTGAYPITSISYSASTLTVSPPLMSTCTTMHPSPPALGLDWSSPFQLGPSVFILLACPPPTSSLSYHGAPVCVDGPAALRVCATLLACPAIPELGLPLFAPTNTCCVYSPASLGPKGELDLAALQCAAYASVVSLGDMPTDPATWKYGVSLTYGQAGLEDYAAAEACRACERSDGVCGYAPPNNYFLCVCHGGVNTTTDCNGVEEMLKDYRRSEGDAVVMGNGVLGLRLMVILGCWWFLM